jgi:hypothetical protein
LSSATPRAATVRSCRSAEELPGGEGQVAGVAAEGPALPHLQPLARRVPVAALGLGEQPQQHALAVEGRLGRPDAAGHAVHRGGERACLRDARPAHHPERAVRAGDPVRCGLRLGRQARAAALVDGLEERHLREDLGQALRVQVHDGHALAPRDRERLRLRPLQRRQDGVEHGQAEDGQHLARRLREELVQAVGDPGRPPLVVEVQPGRAGPAGLHVSAEADPRGGVGIRVGLPV